MDPSRIVEQSIGNRRERGTFVKEFVTTSGSAPLSLVRKRRADKEGRALPTRAPVLLVHGFGQNRYAWHLPSRSFANHLAWQGFDVFNLDLRGHGRSRHLGSEACRSVDEYITEDLPSALRMVSQHSDARPVFLVGHSLGGLVSYAAAPLCPELVAGIVSIGSPYHFAKGSTPLQALNFCFQAFGMLRVPHLPFGVPLGPVGTLMRAFRPVADSAFNPMPLRGWRRGALEPEVLDEHLRLAFDHATLQEFQSLFTWAEKRHFGPGNDYAGRFEAFAGPLLVVGGSHDDLAPPESVRPAYERSRSQDKTYRDVPLGHIDILVGRDAPRTTWPLVSDWIETRAA